MDGYTPVVFHPDLNGHSIDDALVYDATDVRLANIISHMVYEEHMPRPFGILLDIDKPTYDQKVVGQINHEIATKGEGDLFDLLRGDNYWEVD
jgi:hypothetical protein